MTGINLNCPAPAFIVEGASSADEVQKRVHIMSNIQSVILSKISDRFKGNPMDEAQSITCVIDGETSYEIYPEYDAAGSFYISINGYIDDDDRWLYEFPTLAAAKEEVARRMAAKVEAAQKVVSRFESLAA
jgi:hypothetical protein